MHDDTAVYKAAVIDRALNVALPGGSTGGGVCGR